LRCRASAESNGKLSQRLSADDLARFRLPQGVEERLTTLLDEQDGGQTLTDSEKREAEGLVNLADLLSLLRLRAERIRAAVHQP
jgi:hypothetical protein